MEVLGERIAEASCIHIKHVNIWDRGSNEYADSAKIRHVYIREEAKLRRCVQISMSNLWYDIPNRPTPPRPLKLSPLFGHPGIMVFRQPDIIENRLLYTDAYFGCLDELEADMRSPNETDFSLFMDEIMGDS